LSWHVISIAGAVVAPSAQASAATPASRKEKHGNQVMIATGATAAVLIALCTGMGRNLWHVMNSDSSGYALDPARIAARTLQLQDN
jgi:hypothetical protein